MANARVEFDQAGLAAIATGPEIRAALLAEATLGAAYAQTIAPRDTGVYAASFEITAETVTLNHHIRAAARLANTAGHAAAVEYGHGGRSDAPTASAHRVLGRTLDHLTEPQP